MDVTVHELYCAPAQYVSGSASGPAGGAPAAYAPCSVNIHRCNFLPASQSRSRWPRSVSKPACSFLLADLQRSLLDPRIRRAQKVHRAETAGTPQRVDPAEYGFRPRHVKVGRDYHHPREAARDHVDHPRKISIADGVERAGFRQNPLRVNAPLHQVASRGCCFMDGKTARVNRRRPVRGTRAQRHEEAVSALAHFQRPIQPRLHPGRQFSTLADTPAGDQNGIVVSHWCGSIQKPRFSGITRHSLNIRRHRSILLTFVVCGAAFGQTYNISTFAGGGLPVNVPGTYASLYGPQAVAVDQTGNLFLVDQNDVLRLDATTGVVTLIAGNGTQGYSGDNGPAANAQLNHPSAVTLDRAGNLYIADSGNNRIRRVSGGIIITVAGSGIAGLSGDGAAAINAQLNQPTGVAVDSGGNLYIADTGNQYVREVSAGVINSIAGTGTAGFGGDNSLATSAQLNYPSSLAVDSSGDLFISDRLNSRVRKVAAGVITTVAGTGVAGFNGDNGAAANSELSLPQGIWVDSAGNLYIADTGNNRVRKVAGGVITSVAGNGTAGFTGDGAAALSSELSSPGGVAVDSAGNVYIADTGYSRVRKVVAGVIGTAVGNGSQGFGGDNGAATSAEFNGVAGLAVDSSGNLYIVDANNQRIRKVSSGVITTVAGNGAAGFSGDNGPATGAQLHSPYGVAVDAAGNLYLSDSANQRVRKVSGGTISTFAGNGNTGFSGDNGQAILAMLNNPLGVTVDPSGNIYVADFNNNSVREVSGGVISTLAGNQTQGYSGDGGPSISAQLYYPRGVAADNGGNVYVADTYNNVVRKINHGVITTVAGNGTPGFSGDSGPATGAQLSQPQGVAVDTTGNVYIADSQNGRIRKIVNGVINTIAGNGTQGFSGDGGPATSAELSNPTGIAVDSVGNIYVADGSNNRIRILSPVGPTCSYTVAPNALQISAAGGNLAVSHSNQLVLCLDGDGIALVDHGFRDYGSGVGGHHAFDRAQLRGGAQRGHHGGGHVAYGHAGSRCRMQLHNQSRRPDVRRRGRQRDNHRHRQHGMRLDRRYHRQLDHLQWCVERQRQRKRDFPGRGQYRRGSNRRDHRGGRAFHGGRRRLVDHRAHQPRLHGATCLGRLLDNHHYADQYQHRAGASPAQFLWRQRKPGHPAVELASAGQQPAVELAATFDRTLAPGAEFVVQTTGPASQAVTTGWIQLLTSGGIGGYAVFGAAIGSTVQEAVAQLETRTSTGYVIAYDNTNGNAAGIAVANLTTAPLAVSLAVRDNTGAVLLTDTLGLPPTGHTSFVLTTRYGSVAAGRLGTVELKTSAPGQITALGIRGNATGAFSNILAAAE